MRPSDGRLIGLRRLIALLESATIRYAPEDSRNKLRVIDPTEAGEHLVVRAEIDVATHVKGVAALVEFRRISKVVNQATRRRIRIKIHERDGVRIEPTKRNLIQLARSNHADKVHGTRRTTSGSSDPKGLRAYPL